MKEYTGEEEGVCEAIFLIGREVTLAHAILWVLVLVIMTIRVSFYLKIM